MPLNLYGDKPDFLAPGHGADIASQRADDLDQMAIERTRECSSAFALDIACGAGGQSIRLAQTGATVLATDIADMSQAIVHALEALSISADRVRFFQRDMRTLNLPPDTPAADVIVCQRAIHYLPFVEAVEVVRAMKKLLGAHGRLYISASGLGSELGNGYAHARVNLATRYGELSAQMRKRHGIHGPVCLYSEECMRQLLTLAGLIPELIFSSEFGNIKAVACHV